MQSTFFNNRKQKFFDAIRKGNIPRVTQLITTGGVSVEDEAPFGGKQALHIACEAQQKAMIDKLLELGANINTVTDRGFTPLHVAAQQGNADILIALIKAGANVNAVTDNGMGTTPLQESAHKGHLTAVNILIAAGANIHYCERKYNLTAAGLARMAGHNDISVALLGYKRAFIQRVRNILEARIDFLKDSPQQTYYLELKNISIGIDADDYFKELQIKLDQGYQPIKEDVRELRSAIIHAMKQYNTDKLLALEITQQMMTPTSASLQVMSK